MFNLLKVLVVISNILPNRIRIFLADKIVNKTVDKYANIELINESVIRQRKGFATVYIGNHLSNIDGVILNKLLKENQIAFLAGVKLSENPFTNLVLDTINTIPVVPNSADKKAIRAALDYLESDKSIFIFPEGTRSRTGAMQEGKKGFALVAKKANVQIVPVGIEGTEKLLPINNKDMEKEHFNNAAVRVIFGKPFSLPEKTEENKMDWMNFATEYSMKKIAELVKPEYQGVYQFEKKE